MGDYKNENDMDKIKEEYFNIEVPKEFDYYIEDAINRAKAARRNRLKVRGIVAAACAVIFICLNYVNWPSVMNSGGSSIIKNGTAEVRQEKLPVVGSYDNLKNLLAVKNNEDSAAAKTAERNYSDTIQFDKVGIGSYAMSNTQNTASKEYSTTNVQVKGVDEGDVVKTDGKYIYKISSGKVIIAAAYPAEEMKVLSEITFYNKFRADEIFLYGKYIVVIGNDPLGNGGCYDRNYGPYIDYAIALGNTKAVVYDVSDKSKAIHVQEVTLEGNYLSSRLVGSKLYLATNKYISMNKSSEEMDYQRYLPRYKDGVGTGEWKTIDYDKIQYCPEAIEPNYIMVGSLDLNKLDKEMKITTVLGSASNMYVSDKSLYVTGSKYTVATQETAIYKFALKDGAIEFTAKGNVPGYVLNQFSMDENDKYFRITTSGIGMLDATSREQKNNLYILDENLKLKGKLDGMAPGEKIYATRFLGDRAYMVTFKTTDPLFVIDLKNPAEPKVLGELKIPGFSNYLQPYDENHIIGIGRDAEEVVSKDQNGNEVGVWAKTKDIKVVMFDVTDVNNPKQEFVTTIEGSGPYSIYNSDHKALLFNKDKNLLAFPVTIVDANYQGSSQGLYVYDVNLKNGFKLRGIISHDDFVEDLGNSVKKVQQVFEQGYAVERGLYINDTLYTLSNGGIKANNLNDLKEIGKLRIDK